MSDLVGESCCGPTDYGRVEARRGRAGCRQFSRCVAAARRMEAVWARGAGRSTGLEGGPSPRAGGGRAAERESVLSRKGTTSETVSSGRLLAPPTRSLGRSASRDHVTPGHRARAGAQYDRDLERRQIASVDAPLAPATAHVVLLDDSPRVLVACPRLRHAYAVY